MAEGLYHLRMDMQRLMDRMDYWGEVLCMADRRLEAGEIWTAVDTLRTLAHEMRIKE